MYKIIGADGNVYGPISAEQVRQWVEEGRLNAVSKIQVEGAAEWKELRQMPEFSSLVPPPPPPIALGAARSPSAVGAPPPANPLAGWALGTGIASLPCCWLLILSPVSIVLGAMALSQINQNPKQGGRAMATAGIVLGCISLVMSIVAWTLYWLVGSTPTRF
ncbi:MAG TPA: DUF4190 domain-containing protein [Candidatus Acidoferrum sp.]|nr:DUF4190 domain-containing protein [Candidatus Acidoferrum sp.]